MGDDEGDDEGGRAWRRRRGVVVLVVVLGSVRPPSVVRGVAALAAVCFILLGVRWVDGWGGDGGVRRETTWVAFWGEREGGARAGARRGAADADANADAVWLLARAARGNPECERARADSPCGRRPTSGRAWCLVQRGRERTGREEEGAPLFNCTTLLLSFAPEFEA
jgi:hypothetical protein